MKPTVEGKQWPECRVSPAQAVLVVRDAVKSRLCLWPRRPAMTDCPFEEMLEPFPVEENRGAASDNLAALKEQPNVVPMWFLVVWGVDAGLDESG